MTLNVRIGVSLVFAMASLVSTAPAALAQCKGASASYVPMSAVIAQGGWLTSDGRGAYVDGSQASGVNLHNGANLVVNAGAAVNRNSRSITFNLNGPVVGDPLAQPLGAIPDPRGEVHVLYKLDPVGPDGLRQMHTLEELPDDGGFYTSERADLFVHINGVRHLLMFGGDAWPINMCNPPTTGAIFDAPGTTKLQIARLPGSDTYLLQAPAGAIGRLFDYSNTFAPLDKGLYRFSFLVTFSPKPKKGK